MLAAMMIREAGEGASATVAECRGAIVYPVAAGQERLAAAKITEGPAFRAIGEGDKKRADGSLPNSSLWAIECLEECLRYAVRLDENRPIGLLSEVVGQGR
jgi:hypothetical protein